MTEGEERFQQVVGFVLGDLAAAALAWPKMPNAQREFAERAIGQFKPETEALKRILRQLPPAERERAFGALARLLDATMHIAGSTSASDSAKMFHQSAAQSRRGKTRRKPTPMQKRMDQLIAECRRNRPSAKDPAIVQWVFSHWGDETAPDRRTVERHLARQK